MKIDITKEISFRTARSGGKGGQHVNKVETMVEGLFDIEASSLLTGQQKKIIKEKLHNKITSEGVLHVKAQNFRTQLSNKEEVVKKMNQFINDALKKKKIRIATNPSPQTKEKRIEWKKLKSEKKAGRKKVSYSDL